MDALFEAKGRWWCHLLCDDFSEQGLEELHRFAARLGLPARAFHDPPGQARPHYDLTPPFRNQALALGALELSRREVVAFLQRGRLRARGRSEEPRGKEGIPEGPS